VRYFFLLNFGRDSHHEKTRGMYLLETG